MDKRSNSLLTKLPTPTLAVDSSPTLPNSPWSVSARTSGPPLFKRYSTYSERRKRTHCSTGGDLSNFCTRSCSRRSLRSVSVPCLVGWFLCWRFDRFDSLMFSPRILYSHPYSFCSVLVWSISMNSYTCDNCILGGIVGLINLRYNFFQWVRKFSPRLAMLVCACHVLWCFRRAILGRMTTYMRCHYIITCHLWLLRFILNLESC